MATAWLLCLLAHTSFLAQLASGAPLSSTNSSPDSAPFDVDDVLLPPEVVVEALFSQVDSLEDELEECEEQVRTQLQTSPVNTDSGVIPDKVISEDSQDHFERQDRDAEPDDDPSDTSYPEVIPERTNGVEDDLHDIGVTDEDVDKTTSQDGDSEDEGPVLNTENPKDSVQEQDNEEQTRPQDEDEDVDKTTSQDGDSEDEGPVLEGENPKDSVQEQDNEEQTRPQDEDEDVDKTTSQDGDSEDEGPVLEGENPKDSVQEQDNEEETRRQDENEDDDDKVDEREEIVSVDAGPLKENDDERVPPVHDKTEDAADAKDDGNSHAGNKDNKKKRPGGHDDKESRIRGKADRRKKLKDEDGRQASRLEDLLRDFAEKEERKRSLNDDDNDVDKNNDEDDDDATNAGDDEDDTEIDKQEVGGDQNDTVNAADDINGAVVDGDGALKGDDDDDDDGIVDLLDRGDEAEVNEGDEKDTNDGEEDVTGDNTKNEVDDDDDKEDDKNIVGAGDKNGVVDDSDFSDANEKSDNEAVNDDDETKSDDKENVLEGEDKTNVDNDGGNTDVDDVIKDSVQIDGIFQDSDNEVDERGDVESEEGGDDFDYGVAKGSEGSWETAAAQESPEEGESSEQGTANTGNADTVAQRVRRDAGQLQSDSEGDKHLQLIYQLTERMNCIKRSIAACKALRNSVGETRKEGPL